MTCILRALKGRVIVKRDEHGTVSKGGIVYTKNGRDPAHQGTVLQRGEAKQLKDGDRILFTAYAGNAINFRGEDYYIVHEKLILAVLD